MNSKFDGEHVFFTSDTHFSHTNIIKYCDRPFATVEEMNETIIVNWNSVVGPKDIIFHLGDFSFGGEPEWTKILRRLNGRIFFPTQYDVGVDNNNFTPVSFEQLKLIIQKQISETKPQAKNHLEI